MGISTGDYANTHRSVTQSDEEDKDDSVGGKVLMGLNFYGYSYSAKKHADALLGHEYIALLKSHNPRITYDDEVHEHVFKVNDGACRAV